MTRLQIYTSTGVALLVLLGIALALYVPVSQARLVSAGVDTYSAHRPLFGSRQLSQTILSPYPITGLGFILVDLRRSGNLSDTRVVVRSLPSNDILVQKNIPSPDIKDDMFVRLKFDTPLVTSGMIEITLTAPEATLDNPIGVRTDPEATITPYTMSENSISKKGSLAIEVLEEVPAWRAFINAANRYEDSWTKIALSIGLVVIIAVCAFYFPRPTWKSNHTKVYQYGLLAIIAIAVIATRMPIVSNLHGVSGGDPYNYLLIAQSLARFESPFNEGEKRLPGYPLVLIPTVFTTTADDHAYMRMTSTLSAAASLVMVSLLARALKLPWSVQLIAPLVIAWQKDFFATSVRPEPYTFYTFLLLTALVLFFSQRKIWQEILFGIVIGWAALTRQEGFVLAALLGMAWFLFLPIKSIAKSGLSGYKPHILSFMRMFLPALLIVSPFFIHNARTYGNPLATPYFEGERLQIVNSWEAFKDNAASTWGVMGSLWRPSWEELQRYDILGTLVIAGFVVTLVWWILNTYLPTQKKNVFSFLAIGVVTIAGLLFIGLTLVKKETVTSMAPAFIAGIILCSPIVFTARTGKRGVLILLVALSQLLIATWFHPFAKHYQQILPLLGLMIATTWASPTKEEVGRLYTFTTAWAVSIVVLIPMVWLTIVTYASLNTMIDKQNANAALDSVIYKAVKFALAEEGPYGADQAYLAARFYFRHDGRYFYDDASTPVEETAWLKENGVRTLVTTNDGHTFPSPHPDWQELKRFRAEGKDEHISESIVYHIPTP